MDMYGQGETRDVFSDSSSSVSGADTIKLVPHGLGFFKSHPAQFRTPSGQHPPFKGPIDYLTVLQFQYCLFLLSGCVGVSTFMVYLFWYQERTEVTRNLQDCGWPCLARGHGWGKYHSIILIQWSHSLSSSNLPLLRVCWCLSCGSATRGSSFTQTWGTSSSPSTLSKRWTFTTRW